MTKIQEKMLCMYISLDEAREDLAKANADNADMRKRLTAIHDLAAGLLAEPLIKIDESVLVRICDLVQCEKFPEVKS